MVSWFVILCSYFDFFSSPWKFFAKSGEKMLIFFPYLKLMVDENEIRSGDSIAACPNFLLR